MLRPPVLATMLMVCWLTGDVARADTAPLRPGMEEVEGKTRPSEERKLSFNEAGIIRKVHVKDGQPVDTVMPLMELDRRMEEKLREAMRIEAESDLPIEAAKKEREARRVHLERVKDLVANRVANQQELLDAQVQFDIATIRVQVAEQEKAQKLVQLARQDIRLEQMVLRSPIKGVVRKVELGEGEFADPQKPVLIVVSNDPVYVDLYVDVSVAAGLSKGGKLRCRYEGENRWVEGTITFIDPQANAAARLCYVRLSLDNAAGRLSGLRVRVETPTATAVTAGGR